MIVYRGRTAVGVRNSFLYQVYWHVNISHVERVEKCSKKRLFEFTCTKYLNLDVLVELPLIHEVELHGNHNGVENTVQIKVLISHLSYLVTFLSQGGSLLNPPLRSFLLSFGFLSGPT